MTSLKCQQISDWQILLRALRLAMTLRSGPVKVSFTTPMSSTHFLLNTLSNVTLTRIQVLSVSYPRLCLLLFNICVTALKTTRLDF